MHTQSRYVVGILFSAMTATAAHGDVQPGMQAECAPLVGIANYPAKSTQPGYVYLWGSAYGTHRLNFFDPRFDLLYGKIDLHLSNQTMPWRATYQTKLDELKMTATKDEIFGETLSLGVKSKFPVASAQYFDPLGCTRKDMLTANNTRRFRLSDSSALDITKLKL